MLSSLILSCLLMGGCPQEESTFQFEVLDHIQRQKNTYNPLLTPELYQQPQVQTWTPPQPGEIRVIQTEEYMFIWIEEGN
jgi:hypothetical protein